MFRSLIAVLGAVLVAAVGVVAPAAAADDDGWHDVNEEWQPYVEGELLLPAERYCGAFDLRLTPTFQDIRSRVLTRWDSGGARTTQYDGPLLADATNTETGETVRVNLSGRALTLQREDGSLSTYETDGPVGMGWPTGSVGMPQGFYVLSGRHVVAWDESGVRSMAVDQGTETDVCAMVD